MRRAKVAQRGHWVRRCRTTIRASSLVARPNKNCAVSRSVRCSIVVLLGSNTFYMKHALVLRPGEEDTSAVGTLSCTGNGARAVTCP